MSDPEGGGPGRGAPGTGLGGLDHDLDAEDGPGADPPPRGAVPRLPVGPGFFDVPPHRADVVDLGCCGVRPCRGERERERVRRRKKKKKKKRGGGGARLVRNVGRIGRTTR